MLFRNKFRQVLLVVGALFALLGLQSQAAHAVASDYRFEVVGQPVKAGKGAPFSVKIVKAADSASISGAQFGDINLHMPMGKMDMAAPVRFQEQDGNGHYRFNGDLTMYGKWILDLSATFPNEKDPVHASIKFEVVK